jgi:membrane fusion protein, multidrug efflux system
VKLLEISFFYGGICFAQFARQIKEADIMRILKSGKLRCLLFLCLSACSAGCVAEETFAAEDAPNISKDDFSKSKEISNTAASDRAAVKSEAEKADAKTVRVAPVTSEVYGASIEVSGKALALRKSMLSLGVSGLIKQILVERGDRVKKGQALLRLERTGFVIGIRQAEAALAGANAATAQLETEIARVNRLLAEGAAPSATLDDLNAEYKGAKAQVQMAEATLQQAKKALRDSELRAPYDGVITDIFIEKGEQATAMPPTVLMSMIDASALDVQVFVPEEESPFVHAGDRAEVTVDAAGIVASGEVVFASSAISPGARTFEVRVRIDNKDGKIKAGAFARVRLAREKQDDAILLLVSHVKRDKKDNPYVFVADNGLAKKRMLALGAMDGARVLVKSGLKAGEKLIVSDTAGISEGRPVTIEN